MEQQINQSHWSNKAVVIPTENVKKWAVRLLYGSIIIDLGEAVSEIALLIYIAYLKYGGVENKPLASVIDSITAFLGISHIVMGLICIVPVTKWFYRTYNNLGANTKARLTHTPRYVVASFFIPFVCFIVPYQATKEMCRVVRQFGKGNTPNINESTFNNLELNISAWWKLWIVSIILSNIYNRISPKTLDGILGVGCLGLIINLASVGAALYLIAVIKHFAEIQNHWSDNADNKSKIRRYKPPYLAADNGRN